MKTLKLFIAIALVALSSAVANAETLPEKNVISDGESLRISINEKFIADVNSSNSLISKAFTNGINETIPVIFTINDESTIKVLKIGSNDKRVFNYIKEIVHNQKLDVNNAMKGKTYTTNIILNYALL